MADQYNIFKFGGSSSKINVKSLLGSRAPSTRIRNLVPEHATSREAHSSESSDSGDDGSSEYRRRRRHHHTNRKTKTMAASRLLSKSKLEKRLDDDEELEILECSLPSKKARVVGSSSPSPSPPLCISPLPSPPPPGTVLRNTDKSSQILNKANDVLNRLLYSTPSDFSVSECSFELTPPSSSKKMNLRVRCKGKVHKYQVNKFDPFSKVITLLSEKLSVDGDNKILLSHKTTTIAPTDSAGSLSLTTADIIDAVVMAESVSLPVLNDSQGCGSSNITIKVQTSSKHMMYSLAKDDPLEKAMVAFASELKLPLSRLKFSFDGEIIDPSQTAQDLEMENDDCIDVNT